MYDPMDGGGRVTHDYMDIEVSATQDAKAEETKPRVTIPSKVSLILPPLDEF
jgi:hypothetical protein